MDMTASAAPVEAGSADDIALPKNASRNFKVVAYERASNDWYVEPRWCVEQLADAICFDGDRILDPCCGRGTIPDVFLDRGFMVRASDLEDRGYFGGVPHLDFMSLAAGLDVDDRTSIVFNPPYKGAEAFIRQALILYPRRVAAIVPLSFLASRRRHALFTEFRPSDVLICSQRPSMPPGEQIAALADRAFKGGTTDYCWIVWTQPHDRETRVRWLAPVSAS